jgi:hypothetical protein
MPSMIARLALGVALVIVLVLVPVGAVAQAMARMDMGGSTPPDKLPPPIVIAGLGNSSMAITTASPEAQKWFNQGLNAFHDFWDYESARAFEQSVRLDPNCAMCFWGLYHAEAFRGLEDMFSHVALLQAEKLAKHATPAEKLYIAAAKEGEKADLAAKKKRGNSPKENAWNITGVATPHIDSKQTKILRKLAQ